MKLKWNMLVLSCYCLMLMIELRNLSSYFPHSLAKALLLLSSPAPDILPSSTPAPPLSIFLPASSFSAPERCHPEPCPASFSFFLSIPLSANVVCGPNAGRPELAAPELAAAELAAAELAAAELAADRLEAESEGTIDGDFGDWLPRKARFWSSR